MTKVGIARLKTHLSHYLHVARHGEEVVITQRGKPVARLVAVTDAKRGTSRRERLASEGVVVLGKGRLRHVLRKPPKGNPAIGTGVLRALLEERAEGR